MQLRLLVCAAALHPTLLVSDPLSANYKELAGRGAEGRVTVLPRIIIHRWSWRKQEG